MSSAGDCLGICFADHQLFYAVSNGDRPGHLLHVGCIDFNFNIRRIIAEASANQDHFSGLANSIIQLQQTWNCKLARLLIPAPFECWSILPRLVYETPDEREDHLSILMNGMPRKELESTWFDLSNQDYKLLLIRNRQLMNEFRSILTPFSQTDFVSEFELGREWNHHTGRNNSCLTINCLTGYMAVSSYLLGKLRGTTYINYDAINDLPFFWTYYGKELNWFHGIHDEVYIYGPKCLDVTEVMSTYFKETGRMILMNTLESMGVNAEESTYSFKLESSFPAIMLSLNSSKEIQTSFTK
jgi:hypothetical protein